MFPQIQHGHNSSKRWFGLLQKEILVSYGDNENSVLPIKDNYIDNLYPEPVNREQELFH